MKNTAFNERYKTIFNPVDRLEQELISASNKAADELEDLAVATFGIPKDGHMDMLAPPSQPVRVRCIHCGDKYSSSEMVYEYRLNFRSVELQFFVDDHVYPDGEGAVKKGITPMWWCANSNCDGAGYGFDIQPVNKKDRAIQ